MAMCTSCEGWGVVFRIVNPLPPKAETRTKMLKKGHDSLILTEQICVPCGGFGTRPTDSGHSHPYRNVR